MGINLRANRHLAVGMTHCSANGLRKLEFANRRIPYSGFYHKQVTCQSLALSRVVRVLPGETQTVEWKFPREWIETWLIELRPSKSCTSIRNRKAFGGTPSP